jgi:osmotically-inducible protein OsmY
MMRQLVVGLLVSLPLLHGCTAAVVGTAAATGVVVANDRRTAGTMTEDEGIEIKTGNRIGSRFPDGIHVNVTSYNRLVLLTGEVPDAATKSEIERIARGVENVRGVFNELAIAGASSYTVRTNDSVITSKVKGNFVDEGKFNALHVKVVTENSVVYLMGLVKKSEAEEATQIARTTSGVQKVVRMFEYID